MYEIVYYKTSCGNVPIEDFLCSFDKGDTKKLSAIKLYLNMLEKYGPNIKTFYKSNAVKKLEGDIFELRPGNNRILFFYYINNQIVLLHGFKKEKNKTPINEINKAKNEIKDFKERQSKWIIR